MTDSRWTRAKDLMFLALELPADQRHAMLQQACADDTSLLAEVELLIRNYWPSDDIREAIEVGVHRVLELPWRTGSQVGPYLVQDRIGLGATGEVYQAVRNDIQQRVALKFLHVAGLSEEREAAFRREATVLAQLTHPNVAQLHGIDKASDGSPVLVMEYVDGKPLDAFLGSSTLPLEEQLALLRSVCLAVDAVHRQGIVHGDIKPSNILVTDSGLPKVLDFGVARRLQVPTDKLFGLTPAYASPEQLAGEDPTERSDVYSLGVLLFEVLTSGLPYPVAGLSRKEAAEIVSSTEPPRPSSAVARCVPLSEDLGDRDSPCLPWTSNRLRGDLDAIVLKALSKKPDERYASASELAEDIARHLSFRPVRALPWSPLYVGRRFARRHRAVVAIASAFLVVTLTGFLWVRTLRETFALAGARSSTQNGAALYEKGLYADSLAAYEAGLAKVAPDRVSPTKSAREIVALLLGAGNAHLAMIPKADHPEAEADRAIQCFEQARALVPADPADPRRAEIEQGIGEANLAKARIRGRGPTLLQAVAAFERAAAMQKSSSPTGNATSLVGLAEAHVRLAEVQDSAANLKLALEESLEASNLLDKDRDHSTYLRARLTMVVAQTALSAQGIDPVSHSRQAVGAIDEVLALARPDVDSRVLVQALAIRAGLYTRLAANTQDEVMFQKAEKDFLASLGLLSPKSQPLDYARVAGNLGALYLGWAEYAAHHAPQKRIELLQKARPNIEKGLEALTFEEAPQNWGRYHFNLALTLGELGDATDDAATLEQAVSHGESARRVFRAVDYPEPNAANCFALGHALIILGALKKDQAIISRGLEVLQEPIPYLEKTNNQPRLGVIYGQLGPGWHFLWRLSKSPDHAANSLAAFEKALKLLATQPAVAEMIKKNQADLLRDLANAGQQPQPNH
ncbi:MAG: serine/threonine protein kinase [Thermoanaerobaculaceae bacterium]